MLRVTTERWFVRPLTFGNGSTNFYNALLFPESNLLRSNAYHILRNNHIIKTDAAGMQGVAPFMLIPVQEAQHHDGNPAVNKNRICKKIQPGFKGSADLPKHSYRENILANADDLPHLDGQHFVQNIGIKRHEIVNISTENEERGQQQKIWLN